MEFWRVIYEKVEKKPIHLTTNIYIQATEILKFDSVYIVKVCFIFKKQSLCLYSSVYA